MIGLVQPLKWDQNKLLRTIYLVMVIENIAVQIANIMATATKIKKDIPLAELYRVAY